MRKMRKLQPGDRVCMLYDDQSRGLVIAVAALDLRLLEGVLVYWENGLRVGTRIWEAEDDLEVVEAATDASRRMAERLRPSRGSERNPWRADASPANPRKRPRILEVIEGTILVEWPSRECWRYWLDRALLPEFNRLRRFGPGKAAAFVKEYAFHAEPDTALGAGRD